MKILKINLQDGNPPIEISVNDADFERLDSFLDEANHAIECLAE
jgi:hypothetical protein